MALLLWPLLLSIPIQFARAGPPSTGSLTPYLTDVVPTCARRCLLSFVANNYPIQVCTPQNLNCLCITPTTSGYTIGEGGLTCLVSACSKQEASNWHQVYDVCNDIAGTQQNTHSILTATYDKTTGSTHPSTKAASTTITPSLRSVSPTRVSSTSSASRSASDLEKTASTTSESTSSTSTSSISSSPTSNIVSNTNTPTLVVATPATASSTSTPEPVLTQPQLAGVIVASVGAAAVILGLCFLLMCLKRRKARRRYSGSSFGGDKLVDSHESTPDMSAITSHDFGASGRSHPKSPSKPPLTLMTPANSGHGGWQDWARNAHPSPRNIGLALGPEINEATKHGPSPITPSYHTNSRLLPERPSYSLFPPPVRNSRRFSQNLQPPIAPYAPERSPPMNGPRFPSSNDTSQTYLQAENGQRSLSDPHSTSHHRLRHHKGTGVFPFHTPVVLRGRSRHTTLSQPTSLRRLSTPACRIPTRLQYPQTNIMPLRSTAHTVISTLRGTRAQGVVNSPAQRASRTAQKPASKTRTMTNCHCPGQRSLPWLRIVRPRSSSDAPQRSYILPCQPVQRRARPGSSTGRGLPTANNLWQPNDRAIARPLS